LASTIGCQPRPPAGRPIDQGMQSVSSTYPEKPSPSMVPRVFAVLALIIAAVVVAALVAGGMGGSNSSTTSTTAATHTSQAKKDKYYVVQAGDSFSSIAAKEGVSEAKLKRLNPNLDPFGLQPQNCVDLIPHGCRKLAAQNGG
jgi:LysM repeat protein